MTFEETMQFLKEHENPGGKKVLMRHGAREPFYGVRIGDLKKVVKKVKKNHELAKEWMESEQEMIACAGWGTYSAAISTRPNEELDFEEIKGLLDVVERSIHSAPQYITKVIERGNLGKKRPGARC